MHISEDNINFLLIVAAFVLNAIVKKLRQWWAKTKLFSKSQINHDLKTQISINAKLEHIRAHLCAARVSIIYYDPSKGQASMAYERIGEGIREMINDFQGVPTSPISPLLLDLEQTGYAEMRSNYKDKNVVELHRNWGIYSTYKFKIDQYRSITYGSLVISFATDIGLQETDIEFIKKEIVGVKYLIDKK